MNIEKTMHKIVKKAYDVLGRSVYLLRVDTGSCNGCEIEIFATLCPVYDIERFGLKLVFSPRHADVLLVTGPVTRQFAPVLKRIYEYTPKPCIVIAGGTCACSGGIFHNSYAVMDGVDKIIPVDVYIPGCPPSPPMILYGVLLALDLLKQKISRQFNQEIEEWSKADAYLELGGLLVDSLMIKQILVELRRYLGYRLASRLFQDYINAMKKATTYEQLVQRLNEILRDKWNNDKRILEVVKVINEKVKEMIKFRKRASLISIARSEQ